MMRSFLYLTVLFSLLGGLVTPATAQTVSSLINQVSKPGIIQYVRDLSGEDSTVVSGVDVLIRHRVSSQNNNLAADYISERLESFGLDVSDIIYSPGGRNVVAEQTGLLNPDSIYIICAHYDAVTFYGADDNASGVAAVLETARILSQYEFKNTIIYALWDQEEVGLLGSRNYANAAASNNDGILAVMNMDMIAYDSDDDRLFDMDVRNIADSYDIVDDLTEVVTTYNLDLVPNTVIPGTSASDHSSFWNKGYSALLLGEAWSDNDITPGYHNINDRVSLFNDDYFTEMVKLCAGYAATKGVLLTATGIEPVQSKHWSVYPNPASDIVHIDLSGATTCQLQVLNLWGQIMLDKKVNSQAVELSLENLPSGIYVILISDGNGRSLQSRIVKG